MKKSAKPFIAISLFIFMVFAFLILASVGLKLECEKLTKEKVITQEQLSAKKNWRVNLIAQDQALSSEERIVNIAENELGMIRRKDPSIVVTVSKKKIEQISEALTKKYEKF